MFGKFWQPQSCSPWWNRWWRPTPAPVSHSKRCQRRGAPAKNFLKKICQTDMILKKSISHKMLFPSWGGPPQTLIGFKLRFLQTPCDFSCHDYYNLTLNRLFNSFDPTFVIDRHSAWSNSNLQQQWNLDSRNVSITQKCCRLVGKIFLIFSTWGQLIRF